MELAMEIVKNVAAVIGAFLSAATLVTLCSKKAKGVLAEAVKEYGKTEEQSRGLEELKELLEEHIEDDREFKERMKQANDLNVEFVKTQCRTNIKNTFYRYKETRVLPLYEKKNLMNMEHLYIDLMRCNSYASLLLKEMSKWDVDYGEEIAADEE